MKKSVLKAKIALQRKNQAKKGATSHLSNTERSSKCVDHALDLLEDSQDHQDQRVQQRERDMISMKEGSLPSNQDSV